MNRIQAELEQIRAKHDGVLHAEDVVEYARDQTTALHAKFDWDDTEAAHNWRISQAREVIRVSVTTLPQTSTSVHCYVSLPSDRATGGGYRHVADVMGDEQRRAEMLATARKELERFERRYSELAELVPVFEAAKEVAAA